RSERGRSRCRGAHVHRRYGQLPVDPGFRRKARNAAGARNPGTRVHRTAVSRAHARWQALPSRGGSGSKPRHRHAAPPSALATTMSHRELLWAPPGEYDPHLSELNDTRTDSANSPRKAGPKGSFERYASIGRPTTGPTPDEPGRASVLLTALAAPAWAGLRAGRAQGGRSLCDLVVLVDLDAVL